MIESVRMSKEVYIAMKLHKEIKTKPQIDFVLPKGCIGIMFVFEDKKSGKDFSGEATQFLKAVPTPLL